MDETKFYEAVQINVSENGLYAFVCNSTMNTYGFIFENEFIPLEPYRNKINEDEESGFDYQFYMVSYLQTNTMYTLMITTSQAGDTGSFSVYALGSYNVNFTYISK